MTRIVLTYEDYVALPDDGNRYELHEGELSVTPVSGLRHQDILVNLALILVSHVKGHELGRIFVAPTDCIMTNTTVVEPDIVYVDNSRSPLLSERAIEGAPTLAIEIISPSTIHIDRRRKLALYAYATLRLVYDDEKRKAANPARNPLLTTSTSRHPARIWRSQDRPVRLVRQGPPKSYKRY